MNERIRELAEQAWDGLIDEMGDAMFTNRDTGQFSTEFLQAYDQRFAELIVRECIDQLYYTREERMDDTICQSIKERIEKHFGVGE